MPNPQNHHFWSRLTVASKMICLVHKKDHITSDGKCLCLDLRTTKTDVKSKQMNQFALHSSLLSFDLAQMISIFSYSGYDNNKGWWCYSTWAWIMPTICWNIIFCFSLQQGRKFVWGFCIARGKTLKPSKQRQTSDLASGRRKEEKERVVRIPKWYAKILLFFVVFSFV